MLAETRETLPDEPQLQFRIVLRCFRHIAMRRQSDGFSPLLFQAPPAPAVPQGLEALAASDGEQPGANRGLPAKARQGLVGCQEYILSNILALVSVADHVDTKSHYRPLVTLHQGSQRFRKRSAGQGTLHALIAGLLCFPIHCT